MSDLCLQKKTHTVRRAQFLQVAQLCQIFAYRRRHTPCVARSFFGSFSYVRSSLIEGKTHRAQRVVSQCRSVMSDLRLQKERHNLRQPAQRVVSSCRSVMSNLRLQKKIHTVRSAQFLRVAQLCQIFAYRRKGTTCIARSFFVSLSYVKSSLIEENTHRAQRVVSSCRSVMSNLRLQKKIHTVRSAQFLRVAQLCQIFAYRRKYTPSVARSFFGSLSYVRSLLIEGGIHRVQRVFSSGGLCPIFAYRTKHTPCVAPSFLGWLMSYLRLQNEAYTSMQCARFLGWFLSDLCMTMMALNEEGTATSGEQIQEDEEMQRYFGEEIKR